MKMTLKKRFVWLFTYLAPVVIALIGLTADITGAAAAPSSNPDGQYTTTVTETWITEPINNVRLYARILQPDPAIYPGEQFPAVVVVPGGLGNGAPMINQPEYQALAAHGFIVVGFNAPGSDLYLYFR